MLWKATLVYGRLKLVEKRLVFTHATTPFIIWSVIPAIATLGRITIFVVSIVKFVQSLGRACPNSLMLTSCEVQKKRNVYDTPPKRRRDISSPPKPALHRAEINQPHKSNKGAYGWQYHLSALSISSQSISAEKVMWVLTLWVSLFNSTFIYLCVSSCFVIPPS